MKKLRTVADMDLYEQIERLVAQRNQLWRLIAEFACDNGVDPADPAPEPDVDATIEEETPAAADSDIVLRVRIRGHVTDRDLRVRIGELYEASDKIVGNTYAVEGKNHKTGDIDGQTSELPAAVPYIHASGEAWE